MSIRLMSAAWDMDIPSTEKMVLLCLCDHANDDGACWPSMGRLARKCGVTDRTIRNAMNKLEALGIVTRDAAQGKVNHFRINPGKLLPPQPDSAQPRNVVHPGTSFTPEPDSGGPRNVVPPTPERRSAKPLRTTNQPSMVKSPAGDDALTEDEIVEDWNALASDLGLPKVAKLTPARRRALKVRLREYPELEAWRRAFRTIRESPFLRGDNKTGWRADFDFLLQARSFTKLTEGAYGQAK